MTMWTQIHMQIPLLIILMQELSNQSTISPSSQIPDASFAGNVGHRSKSREIELEVERGSICLASR